MNDNNSDQTVQTGLYLGYSHSLISTFVIHYNNSTSSMQNLNILASPVAGQDGLSLI